MRHSWRLLGLNFEASSLSATPSGLDFEAPHSVQSPLIKIMSHPHSTWRPLVSISWDPHSVWHPLFKIPSYPHPMGCPLVSILWHYHPHPVVELDCHSLDCRKLRRIVDVTVYTEMSIGRGSSGGATRPHTRCWYKRLVTRAKVLQYRVVSWGQASDFLEVSIQPFTLRFQRQNIIYI
jgi:hypothetical protein